MRSKQAVRTGLIITLMIVLLSLAADAHAETTFHAETPGAKVSAREAAKLMKGEKLAYRCRAVKQGKNISPVVDPKAPTTWHTSVGNGLTEASLERLVSGQRLIKCESVTINPDTLRVIKAE